MKIWDSKKVEMRDSDMRGVVISVDLMSSNSGYLRTLEFLNSENL